MATTVIPNRPRRRSQQPRVSGRGELARVGHEYEYDLLTAALIGMTVGAGLTYLLRRGPSGERPVAPMIDGIGRGASWAGRRAARWGGAGARWAAKRGEHAWDRVSGDEMRDQVRDYLERARDMIDETVASELHDLRRAVRRQRKRFGV